MTKQDSDVFNRVSDFYTKEKLSNLSTNKSNNNIADGIIRTFIAKRRKALIDQEDNKDDLVSYETSEERVVYLMSFSAIIICVISSTLILGHWPSTPNILYLAHIKMPSHSMKVSPNVAILFQDGHLEVFGFNGSMGTSFFQSWDFKLPLVKDKTGYLAYSAKGAINILYSDGRKDITVLNGKTSHFKIPDSKIPGKFFFTPKSVQVGAHFLIFGGKKTEIMYEHYMLFMDNAEFRKDSLIWNTVKHKYYSGPILPRQKLAIGCPIALNRTHVLILYEDIHQKLTGFYCINAWIYDFHTYTGTWRTLTKNCYEHLTPNYKIDLTCSSVMNKNGIL